MTIQDVYFILTVVNEGSLNKAADKLYVTQSYLSKIVKRVENEYGFILFSRKKGYALELTEKGKDFYKMAKGICQLHENFCLSLQNHDNVCNRITLGMPSVMSAELGRKILNEFYSRENHSILEIQTGSSGKLLEMVQSGEISAAVIGVFEKSPDLCYEKVYDSECCISLRKSSPIKDLAYYPSDGSMPYLHLKDLSEEVFSVGGSHSYSRNHIELILKQNQIKLHFIEIPDSASRMAALKADKYSLIFTKGIHDTIDETSEFYPAYRIHPDESFSTEFYLVYRPDFKCNIAFRQLVQIVRKVHQAKQ